MHTSSSISDGAESYHFWAQHKCMRMLNTFLFQRKMKHYKISGEVVGGGGKVGGGAEDYGDFLEPCITASDLY